MKKGRHRRFEEARALKRGPNIDIESLLDPPSSRDEDEDDEHDEYEYDKYADYDADTWENPEAD